MLNSRHSPTMTSMIFAAFACEQFDDGTRFLRADLAVDCDTRDHDFTKALAFFLVWAIPVGVPCLYYVVIRHHWHQLNAVRRVQRLIEELEATRQLFSDEDGVTLDSSARAMLRTPDEANRDEAYQKRREAACKMLEHRLIDWEEKVKELEGMTQDLRGRPSGLQERVHCEIRLQELRQSIVRAKRLTGMLSYNCDVDMALRTLSEQLSTQERRGSASEINQVHLSEREQAHRLCEEWHPFLGIELSKHRKMPTVARVWPVQFLPSELSEAEEERAFHNFLAFRLQCLQTQQARLFVLPALVARHVAWLNLRFPWLHKSHRSRWQRTSFWTLWLCCFVLCMVLLAVLAVLLAVPYLVIKVVSLCARCCGIPMRWSWLPDAHAPFSVRGRSAGTDTVDEAKASLYSTLDTKHLLKDPGPTRASTNATPYVHIWAAFPMWYRRQWLQDERGLPCPGDELLAVDGERTEPGVERLETGTYDHSKTYSQLFRAGTYKQRGCDEGRPRQLDATTLDEAAGLAAEQVAQSHIREAMQDTLRHWMVHMSLVEGRGEFPLESDAPQRETNVVPAPTAGSDTESDGFAQQPSMRALEDAIHEYEISFGLVQEMHKVRAKSILPPSIAQVCCAKASLQRARSKLALFINQLPKAVAQRLRHRLRLSNPSADEVVLWCARRDIGKQDGSETNVMLMLKKGTAGVDVGLAAAFTSAWLRQLLGQLRSTLLRLPYENPRRHTSMRMPSDGRKTMKAEIPGYIKSLTDAYDLEAANGFGVYWEVVEALRKVIFVGIFVFFDPGSEGQLVLGVLVAAGFLGLYHNIQPYDVPQNNLLQYLCQFTLFLTLLAALVIKIDSVAVQLQTSAALISDEQIGLLLVALIVTVMLFAVVLALLEAQMAQSITETGKRICWYVLIGRKLRSTLHCCGVSVLAAFRACCPSQPASTSTSTSTGAGTPHALLLRLKKRSKPWWTDEASKDMVIQRPASLAPAAYPSRVPAGLIRSSEPLRHPPRTQAQRKWLRLRSGIHQDATGSLPAVGCQRQPPPPLPSGALSEGSFNQPDKYQPGSPAAASFTMVSSAGDDPSSVLTTEQHNCATAPSLLTEVHEQQRVSRSSGVEEASWRWEAAAAPGQEGARRASVEEEASWRWEAKSIEEPGAADQRSQHGPCSARHGQRRGQDSLEA